MCHSVLRKGWGGVLLFIPEGYSCACTCHRLLRKSESRQCCVVQRGTHVYSCAGM